MALAFPLIFGELHCQGGWCSKYGKVPLISACSSVW